MSDPDRPSVTARHYITSPNLPIVSVDGALVQATREKVNIAFFVEQIVPEVLRGKTVAKEIVRELKVEVRLSAMEAMVLSAQIQGLLKGVWEKTDGNGVAFNAPPLREETAYTSHDFQDLLPKDVKGEVRRKD